MERTSFSGTGGSQRLSFTVLRKDNISSGPMPFRRTYPASAVSRALDDPTHTVAELRAAVTRALGDPTDPCRSARPCAHAETIAGYLEIAPSTTREHLVADPEIARVDAVSATTYQALRGWAFKPTLAAERRGRR